ncbi:leukocyte immunoglobulin-like receptor subfamily A member 6 isoform X2 [Peromyscus leucopus]|uniref:leukocyte immunoglobulin-like receptor subfamily A member 6 isoform X2 n=1 Tax=Peromyscus leucopus TaxID=10041 RepID=UPI0018852274|nr:leukocyte immunoglobulin-like receptor subfamily A member 6 isoform X2 [Peromyscus leucopus]
MTPLFTGLLYLGLSLDLRNTVLAGNLEKPTLWAEPSSVIASGNNVTIWCEGSKETQIYFLYKEGSSAPWDSQTPKDPGNKALFSIASMEKLHAGQYRCYSYKSRWRSDPLELVVTGEDLKFSRSQMAQLLHTGQSQALFPVISMAASKSGPFRCYGYYTNTPHVWSEASHPLELHFSGEEFSSFTQLTSEILCHKPFYLKKSSKP